MKASETNGHAASRDEPVDPLQAAEDLRAQLGEALAKVGRLVNALKASRREKKALANVYAGLKQLNLEQP